MFLKTCSAIFGFAWGAAGTAHNNIICSGCRESGRVDRKISYCVLFIRSTASDGGLGPCRIGSRIFRRRRLWPVRNQGKELAAVSERHIARIRPQLIMIPEPGNRRQTTSVPVGKNCSSSPPRRSSELGTSSLHHPDFLGTVRLG